MSYRTVNVDVDVDVDDIISDIDTDDLIDELKRRGADYNTEGVDGDLNYKILEKIYQKRRLGKDYQAELEQLIYNVLGAII